MNVYWEATLKMYFLFVSSFTEIGTEMSSRTSVELKTIAKLEEEKKSFFIDAYQRGYRWTKIEVKDLLDDILEFSHSDYESHDNALPSRFYCLQPIIVTKNSDGISWKVIDGQQRLTTIYLIYLYYINTAGRRKPSLPFELHYNDKNTLEMCLQQIKNEEYCEEEHLAPAFEIFRNDIDSFYVLTAYGEICRYFNELQKNPQSRNYESDMKKVFDNFMKIIWYELVDCDEFEETAVFSKINMGKIPLTNAELIKALLLHSKNGLLTPYQNNLALKWDEFEAQLSDSGFWSFLANDNDSYSTRIDFIFDILALDLNEQFYNDAILRNEYYVERAYNKQYFSFYILNNYIRKLKQDDPCVDFVKVIWTMVTDCFNMFKDWFQNRKWYHMIGYVITLSGAGYLNKLCELYKQYSIGKENGSSEHKSSFEKWLKSCIIEIVRKSLIKDQKDKDPCTKAFIEKNIAGLEYKTGKANERIRNILLLHNICALELLESQTDARFPFDKYKRNDINWDIEHINAVADDRPNDAYDRDNNDCLVWLQNAKNIPNIAEIRTEDNEPVKDLIEKVIADKLYLESREPGLKTFVKVYESIVNYFDGSDESINSISNLTILDSGTNRAYKNDVFPLKRKKILESCAKEIYIPLCTRNVFLKAYPGSDNLVKWEEKDREAYKNDIVNSIAKYLKLEDC